VVYATDVESPDGFDPAISAFITGADLLMPRFPVFRPDYSSSKQSPERLWPQHVSMRHTMRPMAVKRLFLFSFRSQVFRFDAGARCCPGRENFENRLAGSKKNKTKEISMSDIQSEFD